MSHHDPLRNRSRIMVFGRVSKAALALAFVTAALVAMAVPRACAQTTSTQYLFVAQYMPAQSVNLLETYTVDTGTGSLTPIAAPPVQTRGQLSGTLAINPAGTFVFATALNSAGQGAVEVFSVGSDGSLTENTNSPFGISQPQAAPRVVAVSPNGNYLYVASVAPINSSTGAPPYTILDVFSIASDGSLVLNNTFTYTAIVACDPSTLASLTPVQGFVHPTQKWFYLFMGSSYGQPCSGQPSEVQPFAINADGTLTPGTLDILPFYATNGYALTGSPDGTLLFLMTNENLDEEVLYSSGIDQSTGDVSFSASNAFQGTIAPGNLSAGALAVDSTSTFLYSSLGTFSIQDGSLTMINSSTNPFTYGGSIVSSPTYPLIFGPMVGPPNSALSNQFVAAQVNSDGSLTQAPGSPYTVPVISETEPMVLSGTTPIPNKAVMWILPDVPIVITGVPVGQTGSSNVTIQNVGYGPLSITSIAVTGDASLSATNTCSSSVAPNGNCSAGVNFAPTSVGTFTGTLTVETNVATRTFSISATSVAAPPPTPDPILVAPNPILFPDTATATSSPLTFQLQNGSKATGPLVVSSISITGSNPGDFSQTDTCTVSSVPAGSSCSITITFSPQALGARAATLNVNGPSGALLTATLTGTGVTTVTKYTFTLTASGPGTVTQTPVGTSLPNNTTITLNATPNANSSFVSWGGVCSNTSQPACTFILNSNITATANFAANVTFNLIVIGSGTVTQSPQGTSFAPETTITLNASPNAGAQFMNWSPASACNIPPNTPTLCYALLTANTTITATFSGGTQYTLTTNSVGPGIVTQSPAGTSFSGGTSITLTAVPNASAAFSMWSGPCAGSSSPVCTFAINANTTATATFVQQYTLSTSVVGPGTVQQSPSGSTFNSGTAITLTAVPNTGASFTNWSGACAGSTSTTCTFNITANTSVTATFTGAPAVTTPTPSQSGGAGSTFTFALSTTGFSTPPTLKATCAIPEGTCTINGTTLTVTTTAPPASATRDAGAPIAVRPSDGVQGGVGGVGVSPLRTARVTLAMMLVLLLAAFATGLAGVSSRRTRIGLAPLTKFVMVASLALLAACGGGGGGGGGQTGTPAGTYTVTVTATAGTQTATTIISVTVQ